MSIRSLNRLKVITISLIFVLSLWIVPSGYCATRPQLHILAWPGYEEPDFLGPIEKEINADITVDQYSSGDEMYTKLTSAPPGTYDVVIVDAEYGRKLFEEGKLLPLDSDLWKYSDLWPRFQNGDPARVGDKVYAAVARWGSLGLVYNTTKLSRSEVDSYQILFDPSLTGHVGMFDWYLPNMGVLSLSQGNENPYNINEAKLASLEVLLKKLRPQVGALRPNTGQVIGDLRSGKVWIVPGIGEWAAALLASQGQPIDWAVPKEGGIMWVEAFAIPSSSQNVDLAKAFIRAAMQQNNLARLATRQAYYSQVTRMGAYNYISEPAKVALKATNLNYLQNVMNRLQFRHLPGPDTNEDQWISAWIAFKLGN